MKAKQAAELFAEAAAAGDPEQMAAAIERIEESGGWLAAFRAIARLRHVPAVSRDFGLGLWIRSGEHIREYVADDLALVNGLRVLLPPYSGGAADLFRGENVHNRQRRTYGLLWTPSREIADAFARDCAHRRGGGGGLLLETRAPARAIVSAIDRAGQTEYLVDRRRLREVRVVAQYPVPRAAAR